MDFDDTGRGRAARGGVLAGLFGGIVISVLGVALALVQHRDVWMGLKLAGLPFTGALALQPGFAAVPVLVGIGAHLAVSAVWGLGFGVLFFGLSRPATVAMGLVWGVITWVTMFYGVLPMIGARALAHAAPPMLVIGEHLLFGLAVATGFLPTQEWRPLFRRAPIEITG
jgi:hypothetical protein